MNKIVSGLLVMTFACVLFTSFADDDDNEHDRGDIPVSPVPEPSTYAAAIFVAGAVAYKMYCKNKIKGT
jgi:hypothetical protein